MLQIKLINQINEFLYSAKTNLTVVWDRDDNTFYILKDLVLIMYVSTKLGDIVDYIERNVRG